MPTELHKFTHDGEKVLCVRRCDANMRSYNDEEFTWTVRLGAVVVQRWREPVEGESEQFTYPHKLLDSVALGLEDGKTYKVIKGEIKL